MISDDIYIGMNYDEWREHLWDTGDLRFVVECAECRRVDTPTGIEPLLNGMTVFWTCFAHGCEVVE